MRQQLKISQKLTLYVLTIVTVMGVAGFLRQRAINTTEQIVHHLKEDGLPAMAAISGVIAQNANVRALVLRSILNAERGDTTQLQAIAQDYARVADAYGVLLDQIHGTAISPRAKELSNQAKPALQNYLALAEKQLRLASQEGSAAASAALPDFLSAYDVLAGLTADLTDEIQTHSVAEAQATMEQTASSSKLSLTLMFLNMLICIVAGYALSRSISKPIYALSSVMEDIADGNLHARALHCGSDEMGQLGRAVNRTLDGLEARIQELLVVTRAGATGDLTSAVNVRGQDPIGQMGEGLAHMLERLRENMQLIRGQASTLSDASSSVSSHSHQMSGNATLSAEKAVTLSAAAHQVNANVQTIAAGTHEMEASIQEIARSSVEASRVATQAVDIAREASSRVDRLGASSQEISKLLRLIQTIAEQTNLLALNATIEAARAGEAGRGFAVVANEVKELARGTSKAADEIGHTIENIHSDIENAVESIGRISEIVHTIHDLQNTIAGAVEEQSATTRELSHHLHQGALGSASIAEASEGLAAITQEARGAAEALEHQAMVLADVEGVLQTSVGQFRVDLTPSATPSSRPVGRAADPSRSSKVARADLPAHAPRRSPAQPVAAAR